MILLTHSMSGAYGWRLRETHGRAIEAVVGVAPAPPGNIQAVPPMTRETEDHVELAGQAVFPQLDKRAPALPSRVFVEKKRIGDSRRFSARPDGGLCRLAAPDPAPAGLRAARYRRQPAQARPDRGPEGQADPGADRHRRPRPSARGREAIVDWLNGAGARAEVYSARRCRHRGQRPHADA
ncbi:MAG TPA: hypothetical protein VF274_05100 [Alphaproteobacteria bacterium]